MYRHLLRFILMCSWRIVLGQLCEQHTTCHDCISDPNICAWCSSETFLLDNRCQPAASQDKTWCPTNDIQNPQNLIQVLQSKNFSEELRHAIQLKPQKFHLNLRVGIPEKFNFSYKDAKDYPVDIYFLLDNSKSTEYFKNDLMKQSNIIYKTMGKLTTDVCMGLGTFNEKNILPFNDDTTKKNVYSFKHQLSLTNNMTEFSEMLHNITFTGNYDHQESGLDGIAQVLACKDRIKWRDQSRKILVYMTDESYHSANDGKLAGIIRPYNGGCYLDDKGLYYMEKEMDYPTIGIISKMATDKEIAILFVSNYRDESVYSSLQSVVAGSYYESYKPEAITKILKEIYESISRTVRLRVNITSEYKDYFNVTFEPNCGEFSNDEEACRVEAGEEKHFTGTVTVSKYFEIKQVSLGINPKGLTENMTLDVNVISDCECDLKRVKNSSECSSAGDKSCGICECFEDNYGPTCSCTTSVSECRPEGTDLKCSGRGQCICGRCACNQEYGGKFCQYRNKNCPRGTRHALCSDHGSCRDAKCYCDAGWSGLACQCSESKEACIKDRQECNNRGRCVCGECKCYDHSKWEVRSYDKSCGLVPSFDYSKQQCRQLIPCVRCLKDKDECEDSCGGNMAIVKSLPDVSEEAKSNWTTCLDIRMDFGCYANYSYVYNNNNTITVFILDKINCIVSQILIGVISLVVLVVVGLLTLIAWKLLTDARDRREYEQFIKAAQEMESEQVNETYIPPCRMYLNPAFQPNENSD